MKFRGYIDVRMLKLMAIPVGTAPPASITGLPSRMRAKRLRQKWVASEIHIEVWGAMERMLSSSTYTVLQFDAA